VIDESDPLWHAVLKIAEGDRDRAVRMINNPDQLSQYPEIEQLLLAGDSYEAGGGGGGGDKSWEDNENERPPPWTLTRKCRWRRPRKLR
jgi:hypothetical protein